MRTLKIVLLLLSLFLLSAWLYIYLNQSPSSSLPPVAFSAFQVKPSTSASGQETADLLRSWPGITAVRYNPDSDILAVGYTEQYSESSLRSKIESLTSSQVSTVRFSVPEGPQCPVPHSLIAQFPKILFWTGSACALLGLLIPFGKSRVRSQS